MTTDIVTDALTMAWFRRKPTAGLLRNNFKNERVHGERLATQAEMTAMAFEYIVVFYNRMRLHSSLGYKAPPRSCKTGLPLNRWKNR